MKRDGLLRHLVLALLIALVLYAVAFTGIEHRRTRLGPWQVMFTRDASGAAALRINQPRLAITNVWIVFLETTVPSTNPGVSLDLSQPRQVPYPVPFGRCLFMDTTFLPGTVVFELYGHEIQLLPRVLTIDKQERGWHSDEKIELPPRSLPRPPSATQ